MLFAPDWHSDTANLAAEDPPPSPALFARRVSDLIDRGDFIAALVRARAGTDEFPDYATGWYVRARAECETFDYEAARASAERCLALEPDFLSAWSLLEIIHLQLGRLTAARSARLRLEETEGLPILTADPAPTQVKAVQVPKSAPAAAEPHRNKLILVKPGSSGAFETPTLAEVYRRQGLLDRALGVYRRILERHPEDMGAQAMVRKLEDELVTRRRVRETV